MAPSFNNATLPVKCLILGRTGVGKSALINKLRGERIAESSDNVNGVTKQISHYSFDLKFEGVERKIELVDTSGIGDPTVSFEDMVASLVCPKTGVLGEWFDLVLILEKDINRVEHPVRKALQVLDVCTEPSGRSPWHNTILVGSQADGWQWEDDEENDVDALAKFHNDWFPALVEYAKRDGASSCSLSKAVAVTTRKKCTQVQGADSLSRLLTTWPSDEGVEFRPFDPTVLESRYANISGSKDMGMSAGFVAAIKQAMVSQEMAKAYANVKDREGEWSKQQKTLLAFGSGTLRRNIAALDGLVETAEGEKSGVVVGKAGGSLLATASAILVWFPPTTIAGVVCGIAAGATALGSAGADSYMASARKGTLQDAMKGCLEELSKFDVTSRKVRSAVQRYVQANQEFAAARSLELDNPELLFAVQGVGGALGLAGHVGGAVNYAVVAGRLAAEGAEAATVSCTVLGGALAGAGAVLSILDLAYTASNEPPHLSKLQEASAWLASERERVEREVAQMKPILDDLQMHHERLPKNHLGRQ